MKQIRVNERMVKRVREARYQQDRKDACLICRQSYSDCPHSWYEVQKVCEAVRAHDGKDVVIWWDL